MGAGPVRPHALQQRKEAVDDGNGEKSRPCQIHLTGALPRAELWLA